MRSALFFVFFYNKPKVIFQCGFTEQTTEEKERAAIARKDEDSVWYTVTDMDGNIIGETGLLRM